MKPSAMELLKWIDKDFSAIKDSVLFSRYFDAITLERGLGVFFLFNSVLGIDIIIREDKTVKAIHLYSGSDGNTSRFSDVLPFNLDFTSSRMEVVKKLGNPIMSSIGGVSFLYEETPQWDKFKVDKLFFHFQYGKISNEIDLVTMSSLNE